MKVLVIGRLTINPIETLGLIHLNRSCCFGSNLISVFFKERVVWPHFQVLSFKSMASRLTPSHDVLNTCKERQKKKAKRNLDDSKIVLYFLKESVIFQLFFLCKLTEEKFIKLAP